MKWPWQKENPPSSTINQPTSPISFDLDVSYRMPSDRNVYKRAPFAELVTKPPEIADEAWSYFVKDRAHANHREMLAILQRASSVSNPILERTNQYKTMVGTNPYDGDAGRLQWITEFLLRNQNAYEMTMDSLTECAKSGVVDRVEVVGDSAKCSVCRNGFIGIHPVTLSIEIPHPECDHPFGCVACVIPLLDKPLGEA